jgi:hypothetical protein
MQNLWSAIVVVVVTVYAALMPTSLNATTTLEISPYDGEFVQFPLQEQSFKIQCYNFEGGMAGDAITINLQSSLGRALTLAVYEGAAPPECQIDESKVGFSPDGAKFTLPIAGPFFVVVRSEYWLPLTSNLIGGWIYHEHKNTPEEVNADREALSPLVGYIDQVFETRSFKIIYQPCGQLNAFTDLATGNITLCTELINGNTPGRLQRAIFLHELGHSLLSGWKIPGGDRESDCDDFAAAMLLKFPDGIGAIQEFASYLDSNNVPWIDQQKAYEIGDTHPPGKLRAKLLTGIIFGNNPKEFVNRWDSILYPHMRPEWLQQAGSRDYESIDLARKTLVDRMTQTPAR